MKRHTALIGCVLTLALAGVTASLFAATNETVEVVAKQEDNPQQNPSDIEGRFESSPTADKDEIHVTNDDVKGQGAGVYNDPVNDGALLTITQESGPVKVDVEGREGIGAIYWVTVSPGGGGGGAVTLLWADVEDVKDPGALVLMDTLTEKSARDYTNDDSDAPVLYCPREAGATADVEFWLEEAVGGTFSWSISRGGMVVDSGFLNQDNGYSGSSEELEWGYYTIDIARPGNSNFSRRIIFLVTGIDLDIDSDNDNGFGMPDRNEAEEEIEDDPEEPGKYVVENSDDNDNSGTKDWIESQVQNEQFVPLVLQSGKFTCDPEQAVVFISYSASAPADLAEYEGEMQPRRDPQTGLRPAIRIWTKPGADQRDPRGVNAGGDYLAPDIYAWNKFTANGDGEVTFYVEGIGHGETTISVYFAVPDPGDPEATLLLGSDAVRVTVLPRPRAMPDSYEVKHSTPTYFAGEEKSLLVNDIAVSDDFSEGKRRNVILFDGENDAGKTMDTTAGGSVTVDDSGGLVYTPPALWAGTDTFRYKVGNGDIYSAPATVTITVTNTVPVIQGGNYSVVHGKSLRVPAASGVLANAADPEDKPFLTATVVQQPSHGTLTLHASGAFIYAPNTSGGSHYVGQDSFTYKANDGISDSAAPATVQIQVTNTAPGGTADFYEVPFGGRKLMVVAEQGVLRNDSDADGDTLKATLVQGPSKGTLDLRSSGAFIYTITTPFAGTDTFTYRVNDGAADSDPITVTIRHGDGVTLDMQDDSYSVTCGRVLVVTLDNGVLANDSIPGESADITVEVVGTPPQGLTFHDSGIFSFEAGDSPGPINFSYRVTHETGLTDVAQVTIDVVNAQPQVSNSDYSVTAGRKLVVDRETGLAGYASDADGDRLTFEAGQGQVVEGDDSSGPGQIDVKPSGAFVYTPPSAAFVGVVKFSCTASDGIESSDPADITITVTRDNAPPTAGDRAYTVFQRDQLVISRTEGLLAGAADREGDPISVTVTNPSLLDGTLTYQPGGSFKYVPPTTGLTGQGDLSFQESVEFVVHDPFGQSQPATVTFTVVNKAPVGADDAYEIDRDEKLVVSQRNGLLNNDHDSDGDVLAAVIVSQPANGELLFTSDSGAFIYEPDEGYVGTDSFTYRPSDGFRQGNVVTVAIQVNNTDGPVAANDSYRVLHRNSSRILAGVGRRYDVSIAKDGIIAENGLVVSPWKGVLSNDTDPSGRPLSAVLVSQPGHGTLELDASGSFVYVPTVGYVGSDSFTYRVTNGRRTSEVATVEIEVINTAPQAEADSYQVKPDQTLIASARNGVLGNDLDAENDPLTVELVQGPSSGALNLGSHGGFAYTPEDGYTGSDSFTYRASDGLVYSDTTTVTILVTETPEAEPPVVRDDSYTVRHDTVLHVSAGANGVLGNDYTFNDGGLDWLPPSTGWTNWRWDDSSATAGPSRRSVTSDDRGLIVLSTAGQTAETFGVIADEAVSGLHFWVLASLEADADNSRIGLLVRAQCDNSSFGQGWNDTGFAVYIKPGSDRIYLRKFIDGAFAETDCAGIAIQASSAYQLRVEVRSTLRGDANLDWVVAQQDLDAVLLNWGATQGVDWSKGDFNGDGIVAQQDLDAVLLNWGRSYDDGMSLLRMMSIPGDLTGDGMVDEQDWQYLVSRFIWAGIPTSEMDFNGDGVEDVNDLYHLLGGNPGTGSVAMMQSSDSTVLQSSDSVTVIRARVWADSNEPPTWHFCTGDLAMLDGEQIGGGAIGLLVGAPGDSITTRSFYVDSFDSDLLDAPQTFADSDKLVTDVSHGTLTITAGGGFTYVPEAGFSGTDSFTYRARDAYGVSSWATVTIDVTNAAPVAANRSHRIHSLDVLDVAWLEGVVASVNEEDGDAVTAALVKQVPMSPDVREQHSHSARWFV